MDLRLGPFELDPLCDIVSAGMWKDSNPRLQRNFRGSEKGIHDAIESARQENLEGQALTLISGDITEGQYNCPPFVQQPC